MVFSCRERCRGAVAKAFSHARADCGPHLRAGTAGVPPHRGGTLTAADDIVSLADIERAAVGLQDLAVRTPLLSNPVLDEMLGGRILLKAETLQRTGSFKFRGAWNRMLLIPQARRANGVVAVSAGNHALGVAAAGRLLGIPATIVIPIDAPRIKIDEARRLGADVRLYDRNTEDRESIANEIADGRGATLVPPYDDRAVIAGQGTVGLEMAQDARQLGATFDDVLVCCGGGGLAAGVSTAMQGRSAVTKVWSVEPEDCDDTRQSLLAGHRVSPRGNQRSICDVLVTPQPGELTFTVNQRRLAGGLAVTDEEVRSALQFAVRTLRLVVEPGGCAALAALLSRKIESKGRTVGVVLTGGNIAPDRLIELLSTPGPL
jgi:threonine dehydratase